MTLEPRADAAQRAADRFVVLDVVRFVAAMSVLVYHYKSKYLEAFTGDPVVAKAVYAVTKFGYLGVDLFFIISGFVIFASALGRTPGQFAVSRITRIYPTLWVCVTLTALVVVATGAGSISLGQWAANLTLFNRRLGIEDVDGVYWTLEVEVKFYACVFALLLTGLFRHYRVWLCAWLALTVAFLLTRQPFFLGWFVSPEYSSYFIAGIVFFLARREGFHRFHVSILLACLALSSIYAHGALDSFAKGVTELDRWIAVGLVGCFYLLFYAIASGRLTAGASMAALNLGGVTYPLYLLHNRAGKALFDLWRDAVDPLVLACLIAALIVGLSWLVHVYLERRIADRLKAYLFAVLGRLPGRGAGGAPAQADSASSASRRDAGASPNQGG